MNTLSQTTLAVLLMLPLVALVLSFQDQIVGTVVGVLLLVAPNLRAKLISILAALAIGCAQAQAQAPAGYADYEVLPVLPPQDGQEHTGIGFIPLAIVVGVGVGVVGWIGVKAIGKVLDLEELIVTNNAAQVGPLVMSPEFNAYVKHGYTAIPTVKPTPTIIVTHPPEDPFPNPIAIDWSGDEGLTWVPIKHGVTVGDEWEMPATGVWRATLLPTKVAVEDGVVKITAPPGVLQVSYDLKQWETHSVNYADRKVTASPGTFYRVGF